MIVKLQNLANVEMTIATQQAKARCYKFYATTYYLQGLSLRFKQKKDNLIFNFLA